MTEGVTYITDKEDETWTQGWPIWTRLGGFALRRKKELWSYGRSYDCGDGRVLIRVWVGSSKRQSGSGTMGGSGIGRVG